MSKPRVLVFQHATSCPLGTFGDVLHDRGIAPAIVELDKGHAIPNLENFDTLIVLGGPMDVWETEQNPWLIGEKKALRAWSEGSGKPVMGICLGHQLLAEVRGGEVQKTKRPEADVYSIDISPTGQKHPLMSGFDATKRAIAYHGCEVTRLPPGAELLASTTACPNSAFAVGRNAFGLQYHAEATDVIVADWNTTDGARALVRASHDKDAVSEVESRITAEMPELEANGRKVFENFLEIARKG